MFEQALVATDLSPAADHLIDCAGRLQALGVKRIRLFHVEEALFTVGLDQVLTREDRPELEERADRLREQGYTVESESVPGIPWYRIVEAARRPDTDLLVLASHGRGALADSLLGGTASRAAEHAPVPVLILRMTLMDEEGGRYCALRFAGVLDHVLFPTDFSAPSRKAFELLQGLAAGLCKVTLLHVNQELAWEHLSPPVAESFEEDDARRLADMTAVLRNAGCEEVDSVIAHGDAREILLEWANKEEVSLVVTGSRGWGAVKELLLGSTAHALVRRARAPVLLVR